jgi:hypothetical protein
MSGFAFRKAGHCRFIRPLGVRPAFLEFFLGLPCLKNFL